MSSTKTTALLPDSLRDRVKMASARSGVTVTDLLIQGAELALAARTGAADAAELARRARFAREAMRAGLYEGPSLAADADAVVYQPKE